MSLKIDTNLMRLMVKDSFAIGGHREFGNLVMECAIEGKILADAIFEICYRTPEDPMVAFFLDTKLVTKQVSLDDIYKLVKPFEDFRTADNLNEMLKEQMELKEGLRQYLGIVGTTFAQDVSTPQFNCGELLGQILTIRYGTTEEQVTSDLCRYMMSEPSIVEALIYDGFKGLSNMNSGYLIELLIEHDQIAYAIHNLDLDTRTMLEEMFYCLNTIIYASESKRLHRHLTRALNNFREIVRVITMSEERFVEDK